PAPALLSTTTGCLSSCDSRSPTVRATMSGPVPQGNPTVRRTGCSGHAAWALVDAARSSAAAITLPVEVRVLVVSSPVGMSAHDKEIQFDAVGVTRAGTDEQEVVQPLPPRRGRFKTGVGAEVDSRRIDGLAACVGGDVLCRARANSRVHDLDAF